MSLKQQGEINRLKDEIKELKARLTALEEDKREKITLKKAKK